jgi:hypothetical protein
VDIELATSRDGLNWQRPFRKPFWLTRSDGNQFDSGAIFLCPQVVSLEQELRFYYGAYSQGATGSDDSKLASGIGLATMMRDRFAGLQAVPHSDQPTLKHPLQNIGQVTLKPIRFGPSEIIVNADASAGMIRVEILDANAKRIRGFSYDEAIPLRGDSLEHLARWKFRGLNEVAPGEYIIRLHLEKATVYALSLKPSDKRNEQTGSGKN